MQIDGGCMSHVDLIVTSQPGPRFTVLQGKIDQAAVPQEVLGVLVLQRSFVVKTAMHKYPVPFQVVIFCLSQQLEMRRWNTFPVAYYRITASLSEPYLGSLLVQLIDIQAGPGRLTFISRITAPAVPQLVSHA
jgi:hypothetical protein